MDKDKDGLYKQMEDLFKFILNNVDRTKVSSKNKLKIKEEISSLRSFVVGARPARLAIVGRRGAGKSSLINAFFGELKAEVGDYKSQTGTGAWYLFESELGGIDILDTRGLGDRKSTRLNSSHVAISYAVFCLKKKKNNTRSYVNHRT